MLFIPNQKAPISKALADEVTSFADWAANTLDALLASQPTIGQEL
jgi:hypothetical protein